MAYSLTYKLINNGAAYEVTGYTGEPIDVVIPKEYNALPVTRVGFQAFYNCNSLTSIEIPDSVTSIGTSAFEYCSNLMSVVIPDSVTDIGGYAFKYCNNLTSVAIPDSVTSISTSAFYNCSSLTSVVIGNGVMSIASFAFRYCSSLTSVVIGNAVKGIAQGVFEGCSRLTSVVIPDSVTSINSSVFNGCSSLTSITVSTGNANYKSIDGNLYTKGGKTLLRYAAGKTATSFTIPDSVKSIDTWAFAGCDSLTSVVIPDSVTSIGAYAFEGCPRLTSITIPDSVTYIGYLAFSDCDSLTSVTLLSRRPASIGSSLFSSNPTIYCFSDAIEKYKTATNWNTYADNFKAEDMRLYFTMSAMAQKKYFASKKELHDLQLVLVTKKYIETLEARIAALEAALANVATAE